MSKPILSLMVSALLATSLAAPAEGASSRLSLIRDAEIENIIRAYATPVFTAAGLDPSAIQVHLILDPRINAFVAVGLNMFIHTGLLMQSEHAGQIIGVIAHETGHIVGGHLTRTAEVLREIRKQSIIAMVLGAAAGLATGRPDAATAVIGGGAQLAQRSFLSYSRTQESAADQAAFTLLERSGQSARGLLEFLEMLEGQALLAATRQDPYLRTHPLTRERMSAARHQLTNSRFSDTPLPPEFAEMHSRMKAKLVGFLEPPARVFALYKESDTSLEARYARAIAYYRKPDLAKALPLIDGLIAERPDDPYFHELKGQMLRENGKLAAALPAYEEAVRLAPDSPLIRVALAQAQIDLNDPALNAAARTHLKEATRQDRQMAAAWRLLAITYGRDGQMGMAALALAEQAWTEGRREDARHQAERAEKQLVKTSPAWRRAQDIKRAAEEADQ